MLYTTEGLYGTGSDQFEVDGRVLMITDDAGGRSDGALDNEFGCDFQRDWKNSTFWNSVFKNRIGKLPLLITIMKKCSV